MADVRGTVTVLFTDQVSSTEAWQQLGEDAANALRRDHTALLDALISRHHGRTVKNTGDGLMAVFESAVDALDASVAMQQAVERRNAASPEGKRIGLKVVEQTSQQPQVVVLPQFAPVFDFDSSPCVARHDRQPAIARQDRAPRRQADGGVDRLRACVEEIERPDIERAARQVDSRRGRRLNSHRGIIS